MLDTREKKKKKKLDRTYIGSTAQVMSGLEIIQWKLLRKILQKENKTKVKKKSSTKGCRYPFPVKQIVRNNSTMDVI